MNGASVPASGPRVESNARGAGGGIREPPPRELSETSGAPLDDPADEQISETTHRRLTVIAYVGAMVGLVVIAVVALELAFQAFPIPPGGDPGDWLARSYAYVGLPYPSADSIGSPYLYSPLIFPFLGGLVVAFGNPLTAAFVFSGLLLLGYGLTLIHVARTYLRAPTLQVAFVGFSILNGTILYMLFWGAYPNFLGFILFNETMVFLLLYLLSRRPIHAFAAFGIASLMFLSHDLTFAVWVAVAVAIAVLYLVVQGWRPFLQLLRNRGAIAGISVLVLTLVGYEVAGRILNISRPGYLSSNPAAWTVDNIGELFAPLSGAPLLLPAGHPFYLPPYVTVALLLGLSLAVVVVVVLLRRRNGRDLDLRVVMMGGWLIGAMALPAIGYLAHVDTDYPRFLYFLPEPFFLAAALTADIWGRRWFEPSESTTPEPEGSAVGTRSAGRIWTPVMTANLVVALLLVLLLVNVTVPVVVSSENTFAGATHNASYLQAVEWLNSNPTPGSVLTVQSSVRWVEALTTRGSFDIGPTWLLFEPFQITNAEESYWAFNAQYAYTNNQAVLSYSGNTTPVLNQAPMYSVYVDGVTFPILRLLPGALSANLTTAQGTGTFPATSGGPASMNVTGGGSASGGTVYSLPQVQFVQTGALGSAGNAWINLTVRPMAGARLNSISVALGTPPAGVTLLHTSPLQGVVPGPQGFAWATKGSLGPSPTPFTVSTTGNYSVAPTDQTVNSLTGVTTLQSDFANADPNSPMHLSIHLGTDKTSNPAVTLPKLMTTQGFLAQHDIHFVLIQNQPGFQPTEAYYVGTFGFHVAYQNSGWIVLQD